MTDRPLTDKDGEELIYVLIDAGVTPPASLDQEGGLERGARNLRITCTAAGLTYRTAWEGVLAYLAEPQATQFPRAWPTAGHIAARTNFAREVAALPDDALEVYAKLFFLTSGLGPDAPPARFVTDRSELGDRRERAVRAGIQKLGGWRALCGIGIESRPFRERDFCEAYRAELYAIPRPAIALPAPPAQARMTDRSHRGPG